MKQTRMLHIAETVQGGVGNYMIDLIHRQRADFGAPAVRFAIPSSERALFPETLRDDVLPLPPKSRRPKGLLKMARAIGTLIRRERPDVLFLHSSYAGAMARVQLPSASSRPKVIYIPHGWAFQMAEGQKVGVKSAIKSRLFASIERALLAKTDHVICVAAEEQTDAARFGIAGDKISTVLTGLHDDGYWRRSDDFGDAPIQVAFVGRLSEQKGAADLLETIALCDPARVTFDIVGEGNAEIKAALQDLPNVTAYGWVAREEALRVLSRADVLFMPSKWEGLPLTSLEAMRASVAMLTSEIAVLKNLIEKHDCGLTASTPQQFADILMSTSRSHWHALGDRARAGFLADHQFDRMVDRINALAISSSAERSAESDRLAQVA